MAHRITKAKAKCQACGGSGLAPIPEVLEHTLLACSFHGRAAHDVLTVLQARGLVGKEMTPNAVSNRLSRLRYLGLLDRKRQGKEWLYFRVKANGAAN